MTTAPRPVELLAESLASLRLAGCPVEPIVVTDGHPPMGIVRTWARALRLLLETDAESLMILQDDTQWPERGWSAFEGLWSGLRGLYPTVGYGSFHTSDRTNRALNEAGVTDWGWAETGALPVRPCGAQCYVLPRASAVTLLGDAAFQGEVQRQIRSVDVLVTWALHRLGLPTFTYRPSLVAHIGKHNRAPRMGRGWVAR